MAFNTVAMIGNDAMVHSGEARGSMTHGTFAHNLTSSHLWLDRDGASGQDAGNITGAGAGWFVDVAVGDLHLAAGGAGALDSAAPLAEVPTDIDGDERGPSPDVGADEVTGM